MKNWKNICKRGISLAMALAMCLTLLPVSVFAAEAEPHVHTTLAADSETCGHLDTTKEYNSPGFFVTWYIETCKGCGQTRWVAQGWITGNWYEGSWGSDEKPDVDEKCDHKNTEVRGAKTATCTEEGYTGDEVCKDCNTKITVGTSTRKDPSNHVGGTEVRDAVDATCEQKGYTGDVVCKDCSVVLKTGEETDMLAHTPGDPAVENEVEATCAKAGSYDMVTRCTVCNGVLETVHHEGEKLPHEPEQKFDADGHWQECKNCDYATGKEEHKYGAWNEDVADYCTHQTVARTHVCEDCEYSQMETGVPGTKVENVTVEHKDATCGEAGVAGGTYCAVCGEGKEAAEQVLPATGDHVWGEKGYNSNHHWNKCTVCGYEENDRAHKVVHNLKISNAVWNANFEKLTNVTLDVYCTDCGYTYTGYKDWNAARTQTKTATKCGEEDEVTYIWRGGKINGVRVNDEAKKTYKSGNPLPHIYGEPTWSWIDDYSGRVRAEAKFKCTRDPWNCGDTQLLYVYSDSDGMTATSTDATCVTGGTITYTATVEFEGETYSDTHEVIVPAKGHKLTNHPAVEATCTTAGNIEYWTCDVCGWYFDDANGTIRVSATSVTTRAPGHNPGNPVRENEVPHSCEVDGSYDEVVYCTKCNDELSRVSKIIPHPGHHFISYVSNNDATCTVDGTKTAKCEMCDATDTVTDEGSQLGHDWGAWFIAIEPTATTAGEAKRECQRTACNESETKVIPALDDIANAEGWMWVATGHVDATCTTDGKDVYRNNELGISVTVVLPQTGHAWGEWVVTEPTATETGLAVRTCGNDAAHKETLVLPALGGGEEVNPPEGWTYAVTTEPTCTEDGEGTYTYEDGSTVTVTIPATGHEWGAWVVAYEPSYTAQGAETRTCVHGCGASETRPIAALELPEGGFGDTGDTGETEIEIEDEETPLADMPYSLNPEDELTRGHLMYILHWFEGSPEAEISTFIDVAFEAYYSTAIGWAEDGNIARGTPDNKFLPDDTVTRSQMEVFLARYVEYLGLDMEVVLVGDGSDLMFWAEAEVILNEFFASLPIEA